jgi:hypothetical protein
MQSLAAMTRSVNAHSGSTSISHGAVAERVLRVYLESLGSVRIHQSTPDPLGRHVPSLDRCVCSVAVRYAVSLGLGPFSHASRDDLAALFGPLPDLGGSGIIGRPADNRKERGGHLLLVVLRPAVTSYSASFAKLREEE